MGDPLLQPEIQDLVDVALNKAVRVDGPVKLYHGKHDRDGLFAQKKGNDQRAAKYGFGSEPPLWTEEARSSMNHTLQVRLLPGGLERLIRDTGPTTRGKLIRSASELYRRDLLKTWSTLAKENNWENDIPKISEYCTELIDEIRNFIPEDKQVEKKPSLSSESASAEDADFKRRMSRELVIAWKFAPTPEAKKGIANALRNAGIEQIGEVGESISMDGSRHLCDGPAFPGDKVEIVEPGWCVHDGIGEFLLEKAIVKIA